MKRLENKIESQRISVDIASEPVTLAELKSYASITYSDYDSLLTSFIKSARLEISKACSKVFGVATVECSFIHSGCSPITLPVGYFGALTGIEYRFRELTDWQTLSLDDTSFEVENDRFRGDAGHYKLTYTTEA